MKPVFFQELNIVLNSSRRECGYSLQSLISTAKEGGQRLSCESVREIAFDAISAVAQLHQRGVAHCNLKPDNFLVPLAGPAVKVADFDACSFEGVQSTKFIASYAP